MEPWQIVDPSFIDPGARRVAEAVMTMVRTGWQEVPMIDVGDPAVQSVLRRHRIATLVPTAAVPSSSRQQFREQLQSCYVTQMRLQAEAIGTCTALTAAGVEHRILKGLASAFLDYPQPELRHTGDVDLAVRPNDLSAAEEVLRDLGAKVLPGSRAGHLLKGTTWKTPRGIEIDLHTALFVSTRNGAVVFDETGDLVQEVRSSAVPRELRIVHAAGHFLGSPVGYRRMSGLVDVVVLLAAGCERTRVRELAAQHNVERLVAEALRLAVALGGLDPWPELDEQEWPGLDWFDRRLLLGDRRHWGLEYVGRMRRVPPANRLAYLPTWLVPRRAALRKVWVDVKARHSRG